MNKYEGSHSEAPKRSGSSVVYPSFNAKCKLIDVFRLIHWLKSLNYCAGIRPNSYEEAKQNETKKHTHTHSLDCCYETDDILFMFFFLVSYTHKNTIVVSNKNPNRQTTEIESTFGSSSGVRKIRTNFFNYYALKCRIDLKTIFRNIIMNEENRKKKILKKAKKVNNRRYSFDSI